MNIVFQPAACPPPPRFEPALFAADSEDTTVPSGRNSLNQAIIYDDLESGERAMKIMGFLVGQVAHDIVLRTFFWRFDLLEDPGWRIGATAEALNADIIVLSTNQRSGLPGAVARWLKACLAEQRGSCSAVVALLGPADQPDGPDSPRLQYVRCLAHEAGAEFFAPEHLALPSSDDATADLHRREQVITPTLYGILHHATCPSDCVTSIH